MAIYSFIQSLNTTFGTSIFKPVAEILARTAFVKAESQYVVGNEISEHAQSEIQDIVNELTTGGAPDKSREIERIRNVCQKGKKKKLKTVKVADEFWDFLGGCGAYESLL